MADTTGCKFRSQASRRGGRLRVRLSPDVTMTMTMTYSHEVSNVNQEPGPMDMSAGVMTPHRKNLMSVRLAQRARETLVLCSRQCTESRVKKDQQAFAETNSK